MSNDRHEGDSGSAAPADASAAGKVGPKNWLEVLVTLATHAGLVLAILAITNSLEGLIDLFSSPNRILSVNKLFSYFASASDLLIWLYYVAFSAKIVTAYLVRGK